jgi:hypothetical protein
MKLPATKISSSFMSGARAVRHYSEKVVSISTSCGELYYLDLASAGFHSPTVSP